ncbi:MAG: protease PrsW [Candidatus Thermoplasmatota archaeon]|nr:protease PrsW [Candidatus Thermoplasmatota archaeon]
MELPTQAVLILGIIPALFFLYIALKGYEGYYKDKTIFLTFITGIVLGILAAVVRLIINPFPLMIIFIILFAFFEQLLKSIVLNLGRFQFKKETVIYGLTLGLGFGSSFTPFLVIVGSLSVESNTPFLILVALGSFGFILFHAASGVFIGYGIFSGKIVKYLFIAIILQIPFNAISDLTRIEPIYTSFYYPVYQTVVIVYGMIIFIYVIKKIMPEILEKNQKRKRSKKIA